MPVGGPLSRQCSAKVQRYVTDHRHAAITGSYYQLLPSSQMVAKTGDPSPRGLGPVRMDVDGFNRGVREETIGKSWHQSAHLSLQGPAWGMCEDAYACRAPNAFCCTRRWRRKKIVSRVHGKTYTA